MFKSFQDYVEDRKVDGVEAKDGLVGSAKVKLVADYDGPDPKKPTKGEGQSDPTPYKAANGSAKAKKAEGGGFADLGDKGLKYDPKTEGGSTEIKGDWPKPAAGLPKTEQFFRKTKNMSDTQFAEYMLKSSGSLKISKNLPMVNADGPGPFHPHPSEAVRYVAALGSQNPKIVEQLIHELKRMNVLGEMFRAALEHSESYLELCQLLEDDTYGEKRSRNFARALKEVVGPPMGLKPEDEEEGMEDEMGDEEGEDMVDPDEESDDMDDDSMDMDDEMGDEDEDMDGMDDEMGDEEMDDMGDEEGMEGGDMDGMDKEMGPPPKFKKHSHIMGSMSKMGLGQ
jgi:hypothetical protein